MSTGLRDAWTDLVLGGSCLGCGRPGRLLCPACADALPRRARPAWPTPTPPGLVPPWAAAAYDGTVRRLVLGLKEQRLLALGRPLAGLLALAVEEALVTTRGPVVLVPVPSRPANIRQRAHDPTYAVTAGAARLLRAAGEDVVAARLLRTRPGLLDQSGLDAAGRAANLAGSMTAPGRGLVHLARRRPRASAIVCDDVLTTGATAREAQRALEAVGLAVSAVAAVAATRRRTGGDRDTSSHPALGPPPRAV